MIYNHSSLVTVMLTLILLTNLLNYILVFKLESKLEGDEIIDIYNPNALKDLRNKYVLNSEKYSRAIQRASRGSDHKEFYEKVKLEAFCAAKERIGEVDDGGKYVCNPKMVKKDNCTLMSLGLNNQIGYDQHITKATGGHCVILGADKDPQDPITQESYQKLNGQLFSGLIPNELTIPSMLKQAGRKEVELLKIDIEGGEFQGLEPLIKNHYVCQIFIEVHGVPAEHLQMLQLMAKYNFRIFNVEPNPYCIGCCEYSLINEKCMDQFGVVPLATLVPRNDF